MSEQQIVELGKIITILFKGPSSKPLNVSINNGDFHQGKDVVYISPQSPLARAILNHKLEEEVSFISPEGELVVKILGIT